MDQQELLENILKGSKYPGTFSLAETLTFAATRRLNAIAVAKEGDGKYYLAFLNGEPEGALYVDAEGALFGDKAVVHIRAGRQYSICEGNPEIIDAFVMGCRIFEKEHIRMNSTCFVPGDRQKKSGNRRSHPVRPAGEESSERCACFSQERGKDCGQRCHYRGGGGQFPGDVRRLYLPRPGPVPDANPFSDYL